MNNFCSLLLAVCVLCGALADPQLGKNCATNGVPDEKPHTDVFEIAKSLTIAVKSVCSKRQGHYVWQATTCESQTDPPTPWPATEGIHAKECMAVVKGISVCCNVVEAPSIAPLQVELSATVQSLRISGDCGGQTGRKRDRMEHAYRVHPVSGMEVTMTIACPKEAPLVYYVKRCQINEEPPFKPGKTGTFNGITIKCNSDMAATFGTWSNGNR